MFIIQNFNGFDVPCISEVKTSVYWCVFALENDETLSFDNVYPAFVFNSYEEYELKSKQQEYQYQINEFHSQGLSVSIIPLEILDIEGINYCSSKKDDNMIKKLLHFTHEGIKELKLHTWWCVIPYKEDQDPTNLIGTCPLIFRSYEDYKKESEKEDFKQTIKDWEEKKYKIVVRPVELFVDNHL